MRLSVMPDIYYAHFSKATQEGLGSTLIILTGRPVSGMKVAHLAALPRSGLVSSPWRSLWRWWPHRSLGNTGPWKQRPSDYTGRGTKHRRKYRSQSDGETVILWKRDTASEWCKDTMVHLYCDTSDNDQTVGYMCFCIGTVNLGYVRVCLGMYRYFLEHKGTFWYVRVILRVYGYFWYVQVLLGTYNYFGVCNCTVGHVPVLLGTYQYFWVCIVKILYD